MTWHVWGSLSRGMPLEVHDIVSEQSIFYITCHAA
jgi:hypothetical protein